MCRLGFCDDATVFGDVLKDFDVGDSFLIETFTFHVILGRCQPRIHRDWHVHWANSHGQ